MVGNLAELFFDKSAKHPEKIGLIFPYLAPEDKTYHEEILTFSEMADRSQRIQTGLRSRGIRKGSRVLLLAPPSPDLYALVIALMSVGAVSIFVDPAMGLRRILQVISLQKPAAIFSVKKFWNFRFLFFLNPGFWKTQKYSFDSNSFGLIPFSELLKERGPLDIASMSPEDPMLITFTTGSTGTPKGADRSFAILLQQHQISQKYWPEISGEVDMPCFPMIALQNLACGITTVLPAMDSRNPSKVDPQLILEQIEKHQVTRMSGSPAYLTRILEFLEATDSTLPQIRSLIAGGATISQNLCELAERILPHSENYIVYGSTEVEPISFISMKDVLKQSTLGFLVGRPLPELQVRIVKDLTNHLGEFFKYGPELYATDEIGEILVAGPHVVQKYLHNETANRESKLKDPHGVIWHRTGDLAYFDEQNRIVIVGRLKDQIHSFFGPIANYLIEQRLEEIPGIARAGILNDRKGPVTFLQSESPLIPENISQKVQEVLDQFYLSNSKINWLPEIPVDHRHQWKINREALREDHL